MGVKCYINKKDQNPSWTKAVTDKYGKFIIDLPSHLHSITNLNKVCSITILNLPLNSICRDSNYSRKYFDLELSSIGNGIRTYTTGKIEISRTIMHENSETCMKEVNDKNKVTRI